MVGTLLVSIGDRRTMTGDAFLSALMGTLVGATTAFLLAHYHQRFEQKHMRIVSLLETQRRLASQYAFLAFCRRDLIDVAKARAPDSERWPLLISYNGGVYPEKVRLDALAFLMDERFHSDCPGFTNIYMEIVAADKLSGISVAMAKRINELKLKMAENSHIEVGSESELFDPGPHHSITQGAGVGALVVELVSIARRLDEELHRDAGEVLLAFRCVSSLIEKKWPGYRGMKFALDESQLLTESASPREDYGRIYR